MDAIYPSDQRENAQDIYNFLAMQVNDVRGLNEKDILFTSLISAPGTHLVKVVYGMGLVKAQIGKTSPIAVKLITFYG